MRKALSLAAALVTICLLRDVLQAQAGGGTASKRPVVTSSSPVTTAGPVPKEFLGKNPRAVDQKIFNQWDPPQLKAGDCKSQNPPQPELTLYSDGSLHWKVLVGSSDTNDTWIGTFVFFDGKGGNVQGSSPNWVYRMYASFPRIYTWERTVGPNPTLATNFGRIQHIEFRYQC